MKRDFNIVAIPNSHTPLSSIYTFHYSKMSVTFSSVPYQGWVMEDDEGEIMNFCWFCDSIELCEQVFVEA
jgi:hypothetical protein